MVADGGSIIEGRFNEKLSVVISITMILLWALYYVHGVADITDMFLS